MEIVLYYGKNTYLQGAWIANQTLESEIRGFQA